MNGEAVIASVAGAVIGLFFVFALWIGPYRCENYAEISGLETRFERFDGCYVKTKEGWMLKEQLRDVK